MIQEQIEALNHELAGVLSGSSAPAPPKVKQYPMKIQYLIIISLFTVLLQGCIPGSQICYISPAYAGMPKSEMLHISQNYFGPSPNQFFITKINGIAGHEVSDTDLAYGSVRLSDFYLAPGTYSVDFRVRGRSSGTPGTILEMPAMYNNRSAPPMITVIPGAQTPGSISGGTVTVTITSEQAGKTMNYYDFLKFAGVVPPKIESTF